MQSFAIDKAKVYVKREDCLDTIERYSRQDLVEIKILTTELISLYGDGPPPCKRQYGATMYEAEPFPIWSRNR